MNSEKGGGMEEIFSEGAGCRSGEDIFWKAGGDL